MLAPMAGVTDRCFRILCRRLGAGLAFSEMTHADPALRETPKSRNRHDHEGEPGPVAVQIAGSDPDMLAAAAQYNRMHGAQIIDINLGCPAKKVCRRDAGSALMADPRLVARILYRVVRAVDVPVTLKMRTGIAPEQRNAPLIARIAQDCGVRMLSVHGRTRADMYRGAAEYDTVARVRQAVGIPVIVNGDIVDAASARRALRESGADGLMVGRAAQGRPWIFRELSAGLAGRPLPPVPTRDAIGGLLLEHLDALYALYGEGPGARVARKHIRWYCDGDRAADTFWRRICRVEDAASQRQLVADWFCGDPQRALAA